MSLIIKITQNGSSQEYLFNKLGPIVIGSDSKSDLFLDDSHLEPKLLEVKVSGGNIFIKELGAKAQMYLNSVILPYREEVRYHEGDCISLQNTNYQIHISRAKGDMIDPPPFFEEEFKERLNRMNIKIKEKESELKGLEDHQEKKRNQLTDLENQYHRHSTEKSKLEVEVGSLRGQKESFTHEIRKNKVTRDNEESKILELKDFLKNLEVEEQRLKETIVAQNLILTNLKDVRDRKIKEVDEQRIFLTSLKLDADQKKGELHKLTLEHENQAKEILLENNKVQKILNESDVALREGVRIQKHTAELLKEKAILDHEVAELQQDLTKLEKSRNDTQIKYHELKTKVENQENQSNRINENIQRFQEEEINLKNLNGEVRAELIKAEEKLSLKKNQLNQIDYQTQDATRKLSTIQFELERSSLHLKELSSEEKACDIKMLSLRNEIQNLAHKASEDKAVLQKQVEDEKYKLNLVIHSLKTEIEDAQKNFAQLESNHVVTQVKLDELSASHRAVIKERASLENQISGLRTSKDQIENQISNLKDETLKLEHDKGRAIRELSQIQLKLLDCETQISEKLEQSHLEMENYKREERSRMASEKNVYLAEVEAFKQKSLIEVENEYRKKQDEIHHQKITVQEKVEEILSGARKVEAQLNQEATERLRRASAEAQEREEQSHNRIKEAQEFFKQKETDAEMIVQKARLDSRELVKKTEIDLMEDLAKRKLKIKNFLTMKQEDGLSHIQSMTQQHMSKLKRSEEKAQAKLEEIKRKELKKVARIRDEELSRSQENKEITEKELKLEREKILKQILELKKSQETELSEKRKSVLENINSSKFHQQKSLEDEIKREKELFARTKKDRIQNATQAVMNILISEAGRQSENEIALREKVRSTLEMAIDGQNANAMKEVGQVLDFNPLKRKQVLPVLKKYTTRVGIPAAIALILMTDMGSIRTSLVNYSKDLIKQRHSASEIYVNQQKTEWKEKHTFNPETTPGYKASLVENVLYTTDFMKVMENEEFQNEWILKVHDFMTKELELSEDLAINYISAESTLVKELALACKDLHPQFLELGMNKLRDLEKTQLGWLSEKITDPLKMDKFTSFRKNYFEKFYQEKFLVNRGVATENKNI